MYGLRQTAEALRGTLLRVQAAGFVAAFAPSTPTPLGCFRWPPAHARFRDLQRARRWIERAAEALGPHGWDQP